MFSAKAVTFRNERRSRWSLADIVRRASAAKGHDLRCWYEYRSTTKTLYDLEDHILRDIGLDRSDIIAQSRRVTGYRGRRS